MATQNNNNPVVPTNNANARPTVASNEKLIKKARAEAAAARERMLAAIIEGRNASSAEHNSINENIHMADANGQTRHEEQLKWLKKIFKSLNKMFGGYSKGFKAFVIALFFVSLAAILITTIALGLNAWLILGLALVGPSFLVAIAVMWYDILAR
ncbi:hypothetical protein IKH79_03855 [Candidatus Saccharibacteria bacterium]|nr:hypothetical protein [Candidatus Saccharibacteria bacterium]